MLSSLEQAVHERWSSYRPLTDLAPADRVITGWLPAADAAGLPMAPPFVSLVREKDAGTSRTSSGTRLDLVVLQFRVWAEDLDSGKAIAEQIVSRFNRASFAWPGGEVLDMKKTNHGETRRPDGLWLVMVEFHVRLREGGET